jgi:hypothetical protein
MTYESSARDILIGEVRSGQITPDAAEQEAARQGLGPLAREADPVKYNPDEIPWWSLPMAVAWIAWRDFALVREQCAEYRKECWHWIFVKGAGWDLQPWGPSTAVRLSLVDAHMVASGNLPLTAKVTVAEAQKQLLAACSEGRIVAIAKDASGKVVEIPRQEFPYLNQFEEQGADVFKHDALDRQATYSEIMFSRDALKQAWGVLPEINEEESSLPVLPPFGAISLALAAHWIASKRGTVPISLSVTSNNSEQWRNAYMGLAAAISAGRVEATGRKDQNAAPEPIPAHLFADIPVCFPSHDLASQEALFEHVVTDKFQLEAFPDQDSSGAEIRQGRKVWFMRIHVNAEQVLAQWPALAIAATPDKSGGQSFRNKDAPLVEEMRTLITSGKAKSASAAAAIVAPRAPKLGDVESVAERLRRLYGKKYPTRPRR